MICGVLGQRRELWVSHHHWRDADNRLRLEVIGSSKQEEGQHVENPAHRTP
jgi:hypothetical protein